MKLYTQQQVENSFFWDLETVAAYPSLEAMPENLKAIWMEKFHFKNFEKEVKFLQEQVDLIYYSNGYNDISGNDISEEADNFCYIPTPDQIYLKYAALYAEFNKIICFSYGYFDKTDKTKYTIDSIANEDELIILNGAKAVFEAVTGMVLTGYNISGFDIPVLIKRMLINNIELPYQLQIRGKKPWEITINDMMQDWKSTSWDSISLDLLCVTLGIDTPKDLIKNWEVSTNYHNKKISVDDIRKYCEKDVKATIEVALRLI